MTLLFVASGLAVGAVMSTTAVLHGRSLRSAVVLTTILFIAAGVARTSPWWRTELHAMNADRLRWLAASSLFLFVAAAACWHFLSVDFNWGIDYPLPGILSSGLPAIATLVLLSLLAVVLALRLPAHRWTASALAWTRSQVASVRSRRTVDATEVSSLPVFPLVDEWDEPVAGKRKGHTATDKRSASRRSSGLQLENTAVSTPMRTALPPIDIFEPAPKGVAMPDDLEFKARRIEETLANFNVGAKVVGLHSGPRVTQFDVQPDKGVKVRRITELQNDLALALAAPTIRIQAPVPGQPVVGIEIPNTDASMVTLRDLLDSEVYQRSKSPLKVALGKDVAGNPAIIDLAKMPHLLIAGSTGSGKSVCVNTLISCLLYNNSPEDVRLMMVDPKMVELTVYNGIPHLLSPVVTDMDKVVGVLQWALREMDRRYKLLADASVRNIERYNEKIATTGTVKLPYIVVIVDELADLMMVAPEDVEDAICRLAQLARACGIHLVLATQRPSVDVVTGLIKTNFPARIAFRMSSQVDSRTILDMAGAEKLLGRGDMLYKSPDGDRGLRLQGPYLPEDEIEQLVEFWQRSPLLQAVRSVPEEEFVAAEKAAVDFEDDLLEDAIHTVREFQHASVSLLQRRLKVGYSRAARLMDQLEARGIVGPVDGSKQRPVLAPQELEAGSVGM